MKLRISAAALALFVVAPFALAQTVKVGPDIASPAANGADLAPASTRTDISLDGATASGSITSVTIYWSDAACSNAFVAKVFRRQGDLLTPIAARGPFTTTSNVMTVDMNPRIGIEEGDLIGIVRVGDCGAPGTVSGTSSSAGYLSYSWDVTTNTTIIDGQRQPDALAIVGSGPATSMIGAG